MIDGQGTPGQVAISGMEEDIEYKVREDRWRQWRIPAFTEAEPVQQSSLHCK